MNGIEQRANELQDKSVSRDDGIANDTEAKLSTTHRDRVAKVGESTKSTVLKK